MVFYWSLSDSKSPQVSTTLLSILADLDNSVIWIVTTLPLISKSSSSFTNLLVTILKASIIIGIIVTFMFHSFLFNSLARSRYLSFFSLSFHFTVVSRDNKIHNSASYLFLLIIIKFDHLDEIRWSICITKYQRSLCVSFSSTEAGLWIYHWFEWSNFNFLHNSLWITLPAQLILFLCLFSAFANYVIDCFVSITCYFVASYLFLLYYYLLL